MADRPRRQTQKNIEFQKILFRQQERNKIRKIRKVLLKLHWDRTPEDIELLNDYSDVADIVQARIEKQRLVGDRTKEIFDPPDVLEEKAKQLAEALKNSSSTVVYTGAGISTAAHIPDYRGPDGVWTSLQKGKKIDIQDLSYADPTFTHMAIKQLHKMKLVNHVVSQNCDGLHLRSGLPSKVLSEVHGNMYIEVCPKCKPLKQYIRLFDVTEHTGLHRHNTGRFCVKCGIELKDTIVHFGEKGTLSWPLNWKGAAKAASQATMIVCLGTSLKVLKRYHCLWAADKPQNKRPKLYVVNLQWTPKDSQCTLKIHGKCDQVMEHVMSVLGIEVPKYQKEYDPIFQLATPLRPEELNTTSRLHIVSPVNQPMRNLRRKRKELKKENCFKLACDEQDKKESLPNQVAEMDTSQTDLAVTDQQMKPEITDFAPKKHSLSGANEKLSGWYGKGYSKWKKAKKRKIR